MEGNNLMINRGVRIVYYSYDITPALTAQQKQTTTHMTFAFIAEHKLLTSIQIIVESFS